MQSRVKTMVLVILYILIYNTTHPMLRLKQAKNDSPAYLFMHKKKSEGDPRIPREQKREGFEFVVIAGQTVIQGAGSVASTVGSGVVLVAANFLTKWVTGKDLLRHQLDRDVRREAKYYDQEADYKAQRKAEKKALKEEQARAIEMFSATQALSLNKEQSLPKENTSIEIESIKQVDRNNPEDRAWLEDFARKICPSGGYTITTVGDIRTPTIDEESTYVSAHSMPPMGPKKPNKNNKHHMKHEIEETSEKFYDAIGHRIGEHALDEVMEEWKHEDVEHHTLKNTSEVKSVHRKKPNYSSGKRLEYWKKDYDAKHTKEKKEIESQLIEEKNKFEEPAVAQVLHPETTRASGIAPKPVETNASRWARDDYYSSSSSSYGSSSSSSYDRGYYSSWGSSSDLTTCTLYKDDEIKTDLR